MSTNLPDRPRQLVPAEVDQIRPASALFEAIQRWRINAATKKHNAQRSFVEALRGIEDALGGLDDARLRRRLSANRLANVNKYIAFDDAKLDNDLLEEQERGLDLKSKAKIRAWQRTMEEDQEEGRYQKSRGIKTAEAEPSQEAEELKKDLGLVAEVHKAYAAYNAAYREAVERAGGEDKLSDREREDLRRMREVLDMVTKDSGLAA
jgi:hypothetical protein